MKPSTELNTASWLQQTHARLEANRERLNRINVFPVADGDTGANMAGTLGAALEQAEPAEMARAALLNARGNSGTILAAWLAGFLGSWEDSAPDLTAALDAGAQRARGVLLEPKEGTMLSVMEAAAREEDFMTAAFTASQETAQLLPENKQAGTCDSGALGFLLVLNELAASLNLPTRAQSDFDPLFGAPQTAALPTVSGTEIEVMFEVLLPQEQVDTFRQTLPSLGNSISLTDLGETAGQQAHLAVHIHTSHAQKVLKFADRMGTISKVRTTALTGEH